MRKILCGVLAFVICSFSIITYAEDENTTNTTNTANNVTDLQTKQEEIKEEPEKVIKLYTVKLERPLAIRHVDIEASSEEEAISMAFDMYDDDKIIFWNYVEYEVIETKDINY